jgi:hypothetical protein
VQLNPRAEGFPQEIRGCGTVKSMRRWQLWALASGQGFAPHNRPWTTDRPISRFSVLTLRACQRAQHLLALIVVWTAVDPVLDGIAIAKALFRHTRSPRWLCIDEAHNFAPRTRSWTHWPAKCCIGRTAWRAKRHHAAVGILASTEGPQGSVKIMAPCNPRQR